MEMTNTRASDNGVNGSTSNGVAVVHGRSNVQQVFSIRHQATAGQSPLHAQQTSGSRYRGTATTFFKKIIATWNVNTLFQAGRFNSLIK